MEKSLSTEEDRHLIMGEVTRLTNESGINVQSLVPASRLEKYYNRLVLELKGMSNFDSLLQFFKMLEDSRPNIVVSKLTVNNQILGEIGGIIKQVPRIDLALETYLKKE